VLSGNNEMKNSGVILLLGMISGIHEGFARLVFFSYLVAASRIGFALLFVQKTGWFRQDGKENIVPLGVDRSFSLVDSFWSNLDRKFGNGGECCGRFA